MFIEVAVQWLLGQAGSSLFNAAKLRLLEQMGLSSPPLTVFGAKVLVDDYYQRITHTVVAKFDEERITRLKSAIEQLKRSTKMIHKQVALSSALYDFAYIACLPEEGQTGNIPNAQLRSFAFLGIAAVHAAMSDAPQVIAENIVYAVYADISSASEWFGSDVVQILLAQNQVTIPSSISQPLGTMLYTYNGHTDLVESVAWSPNGKYIASGGEDGTVQVWDAFTGTQRLIYKGLANTVYLTDFIRFVAWSPNGKYIASGGVDGTVQIWQAL